MATLAMRKTEVLAGSTGALPRHLTRIATVPASLTIVVGLRHNKVSFAVPDLNIEDWDFPPMLKKAELAPYRQALLSLQARLRGDVAQLTDEALETGSSSSDSKSPTHLAELGSQNWEQDFALRVAESDQEILEEITAALKRIELGSYGLCEACVAEGKTPAKSAIPKRRLQAIPYCRNCIECERKREEMTA